MTCSRIAGNLVGPASTSPKHFMVKLESLLVFLASLGETSLVRILSKRSLEVIFS
jgi:hypothetical protein